MEVASNIIAGVVDEHRDADEDCTQSFRESSDGPRLAGKGWQDMKPPRFDAWTF